MVVRSTNSLNKNRSYQQLFSKRKAAPVHTDMDVDGAAIRCWSTSREALTKSPEAVGTVLAIVTSLPRELDEWRAS